MGKDTKKQHYVPEMYLKNFCFDDNRERCYEYNPYSKLITKKRISEICAKNYTYEIKNQNGDFLVPSTKNVMEKALSKVETTDAVNLNKLISRINKNSNYIFLSAEEREFLLGFLLLMVVRNPVTKDAIPDAIKLSLGLELKKHEEKDLAWLITLDRSNEVVGEINNSVIGFLKTSKDNPFITTGAPFYFVGYPLQRDFYMPLSPQIAVKLSLPENSLINVNKCSISWLSKDEVIEYNCRLLSREVSIISSSKITLRKYVNYMDEADSLYFNPYVFANLKFINDMPDELFHQMIIMYITQKIENDEEVFVRTYQKMIAKGIESNKAKSYMANAIKDKIKKIAIINKEINTDEIEKTFKKMLNDLKY